MRRTAPQTRNRRRITLAVIEALLRGRGVDPVAVWWTGWCASVLSGTDPRLALGEAFDLAGAMGLVSLVPTDSRCESARGRCYAPADGESLLN